MSLLQNIAIWALPVTLAITVHEAAHGYAARACGDNTAERAGRLSLNPLRHIDLVGTLLVPGVLLAIGGFLFGWAKPVPINPGLFHHPRRDMAWVAAAGPLSNAAMMLTWALLYWLLDGRAPGGLLPEHDLLPAMALAGIVINAVLMVLNLLPIPPLDGGRILHSLLPAPAARWLDRFEPYGLLVIIALVAVGWLSPILAVPLDWLLARLTPT